MSLCSPRAVQELLSRHHLQPNKSLGQNFLIDGNYLGRIVDAVGVSAQDAILEIGPGLGTLTRALAERGATVMAIEKDRHLLPPLQETLAGLPVQLVVQDALEVDYHRLMSEAAYPKVVANLPYYVTTPLIIGLLRSGIQWRRLVFLVQREVVERVMARPGQKAYGLLAIVVQYYTRPQMITSVPATAFWPRPKVASAVIQLDPVDTSMHGLQVDAAQLFDVARAALSQRRKTLINALSAALQRPRAELQQLILDLGWERDRRGETLSVEDLARLTNRLSERQ